MISCEKEVHVDNKFNNHLTITGNINGTFGPQKTLNKTTIKLRNIPAVPALLHGSENWTVKGRNTRRKAAAGMKYVRSTAGCTWTDHKKTQTLQKNKTYPPVWIKYTKTEVTGCNI